MASIVSIVIKTTGAAEVNKDLKDIESHAGITGQSIVTAMQKGSIAISAAGVGLEAFARSQQDMNVQVGQTAAAMGVSDEAFRHLATSIASAGLPLSDVVPLLKLGNEEGLKGDALKDYANFWDDVGDATGRSSVELAKAATGLRAVGVAAGQEGQALAAFGFITDHTKLGVDDFLALLTKKGKSLHDFGIDVNDTAAILGVMEKSLGLTGKAAATDFASALEKSDGTMAGLLKQLGITKAQFDEMRKSVDDSSGVIERNAQIQEDSITSFQRWKETLDEFLFSHADVVKGLSDFAPLIIAVGPAINIATAAYGGMTAAIGFLTGAEVAETGAASAAAGAIAAEGTAAAAATPEIAALAIAEEAAGGAALTLPGGFLAAAGGAAGFVTAVGLGASALAGLVVSSHDSNTVVRDGALVFANSGKAAEDAESAWRRSAIAAGANRDEVFSMSKAQIDAQISAGSLKTSQQEMIEAVTGAGRASDGLAASAHNAAAGMADAGSSAVAATSGLWGFAAAARAGIAAAAAFARAGGKGNANADNGPLGGFFDDIQSTMDTIQANAPKPSMDLFGNSFFPGAGGGGGGGGGGAAAAKQIVQSFAEAMVTELQKTELDKEFGSAGERVMEAFGAALADPPKGAAIAPAIASLISDAEKAGIPNAAALGANLINAIGDGLQTGDWAGIYTAMHSLGDSFGEVGVAQRKAVDDIEKAQGELVTAFLRTQGALGKAAQDEAAAMMKLGDDHVAAVARIKGALADQEQAFNDARQKRVEDFADAKKERAADLADSMATRHQDAEDAKTDRHTDAETARVQRQQDSADRLEQLASDHADKLQAIDDQEAEGVTRQQYDSLEKQRKAEEKRYTAAVEAEHKRAQKADDAAAAALVKQDAAAAKSLAKQDEAAVKSLAKQDEKAATALRKQDDEATKALGKQQDAEKTALDDEDKNYKTKVEAEENRYQAELRRLKQAYADEEKAANEHMAEMAKILGTSGHMRPITLDPTVPRDGDWAWDSANQRWVDTKHMPLPGYAGGTDFARGGLSWVGEHGPELMNVPRGAQVFSASESKQIATGAGGVQVHIHGDVYIRDEQDLAIVAGNIGFAAAASARGAAR